MKDNQIYFYNTTVDEALEMLDMESRRDNAMINFDEFEVKLNKKGDHVMVTLVKSLDDMTVGEGIVQLKVEYPGKFRDIESIERVEAVLALNPTSNWWGEILDELHRGYPLAWRVEEILIETEERIENPDEDVLAMLDQAIASNPRFRLLHSFKEQFLAGRELSDRQMEILEQNLGSSAPSNTNQLARINEALALDPSNRFLGQLKSKADDGFTLSERQMNVVEEIIGSQSSPASRLLADLKANAYLEREDFMLINKGQRRGIDSLNDDERKRLRHLIYRNQRKLNNTYSKEDVRTLLKKGSAMRKLSSRSYFKVLHHYIDPETNQPSVENKIMTLKELVEELRGLTENRVEQVSDRVIFVGYGDYSGTEYSYTVKRADLFELMLKENFSGLF